jgi:hypothetical protein
MGVSVGVADSSLVPQLSRILKELKPWTLIIMRPIEGVISSFKRYMNAAGRQIDEAVCRDILRCNQMELKRWADYDLVKTVDYNALDDYDTALACLQWLLPGQDFPDLKQLMTMRIELRQDHAIASAMLPHTSWHVSRETFR